MENQNTVNQQELQWGSDGGQTTPPNTQQQEKLFTQEEVNRIIGERLARVKGASMTSDAYAEREQSLNQRELQLDAREKLADAGISKDYLPLVNCSSEKEMNESIKLIGQLMGHQEKKPTGYRVVQKSTRGHSAHLQTPLNGDPDIRKAMGLKG